MKLRRQPQELSQQADTFAVPVFSGDARLGPNIRNFDSDELHIGQVHAAARDKHLIFDRNRAIQEWHQQNSKAA
jgi:hypothetical protein